MFEGAKLYTVFPAKDVERLKKFFSERLELEPVDEKMGMYFYRVGNAEFFMYESAYAGTNQATMAAFDVPDLQAVVDDLSGRGVVFEQYDMPGTTMMGDIHVMEVDGIMMKSVWFKDSEGNIININEHDERV